MSFQRFIRNDVLPLGWCPGCGLHALFYATCEVLDELDKTNTIIVSGIGCTARGAGFFNLDSVHGIHGRAIPLAVGVKAVNPDLNVVVFSGEGDITGIGGNHLLHVARRDDNIVVICNNNEVFAMTGGQSSPTTRIGGKTLTAPEGNVMQPLNIQGIITSNKRFFYARATPVFKEHLKECLKQAFEYDGFVFVEIVFPCIENYSKKMDQSLACVMKDLKGKYKICNENRMLKDDELGIFRSE